MGRLRRGRFLTHRARRRMVMVVAALASAAALVLLARWPWQEGATPNDAPAVADRQITERQISERPGPVDSEPEAATKTGATPRDTRSPVATVTTALRTTVELRTSRREILRELRRGGPEVIESLVDALQNGEGETALAAAQLLASLATSEADAAARRVLEDGVEDGGEESLPAETAEMLVEELLRRRDPAGRRLARSLLETPRAARLIIHQLNEAQSLWAADLLRQASASNSLSLASEAIGLLSQRRPRRAATAFWPAAENFAVSGPPRATATGPPEPPSGLADFLRQTLPLLARTAARKINDRLASSSQNSSAQAMVTATRKQPATTQASRQPSGCQRRMW